MKRAKLRLAAPTPRRDKRAVLQTAAGQDVVLAWGPMAGAGGGGFGAPVGAPIGNDGALTQVLAYVRLHGGGTVAVSSQSTAASAIITQHAHVAGIGGFSGRESDVSVSWLAAEVRAGHIRWVLADRGGSGGGPGAGAGRLPGDTRTGSVPAMAAAARVCRPVKLASGLESGQRTGAVGAAGGAAVNSAGAAGTNAAATLYDCQGRAGRLAALR
jgi:hypothetical protein